MFVEDPDAFDDEDGGDPGSDPVDPDAVPVLEVDPTGTFSCSLLAPVVLLEIIATFRWIEKKKKRKTSKRGVSIRVETDQICSSYAHIRHFWCSYRLVAFFFGATSLLFHSLFHPRNA